MKRLVAFVVFCLGASVAVAASEPTLVLLPFDNFSAAPGAPEILAAQVQETIRARGWRVVTSEIEPVLATARVRYLDSIDDGVRREVISAANAEGLIVGTIYTWSEGRNPAVAFSMRLVRADGTVMWSDIAARTSDDTERVLGFGRKTKPPEIAADALSILMRQFPRPGDDSSPVRGPSRRGFSGRPSTYARPADAPRLRICVLPFGNESSNPSASRIVTEILSIRLAARDDIDVVEPAVLRAAALKTRAGSFRTITSESLQKLAGLVGTPYFIRGTVYDCVDPATSSGTDPKLDVEYSLVDVKTGRIVWAAQHARSGSDYTGFLLLGKISSVVSLADHTLSEMIDAGLRSELRRSQK